MLLYACCQNWQCSLFIVWLLVFGWQNWECCLFIVWVLVFCWQNWECSLFIVWVLVFCWQNWECSLFIVWVLVFCWQKWECSLFIVWVLVFCRQNWECSLFIVWMLVFYWWVELFLYFSYVIILNLLCYDFWQLILFDKYTRFCIELAHSVCMITQIWTLAVMVKHCGQGHCSVKCLTLRLLMSYIYGAPILDVSRSHTTTQHSR